MFLQLIYSDRKDGRLKLYTCYSKLCMSDVVLTLKKTTYISFDESVICCKDTFL